VKRSEFRQEKKSYYSGGLWDYGILLFMYFSTMYPDYPYIHPDPAGYRSKGRFRTSGCLALGELPGCMDGREVSAILYEQCICILSHGYWGVGDFFTQRVRFLLPKV
jgi:hypothetical protein